MLEDGCLTSYESIRIKIAHYLTELACLEKPKNRRNSSILDLKQLLLIPMGVQIVSITFVSPEATFMYRF